MDKNINLDEKNSMFRIFGKEVCENLANLKLAVVGAGTSGAELLKTLALMDVATNTGRIHLLDCDLVK